MAELLFGHDPLRTTTEQQRYQAASRMCRTCLPGLAAIEVQDFETDLRSVTEGGDILVAARTVAIVAANDHVFDHWEAIAGRKYAATGQQLSSAVFFLFHVTRPRVG